MCLFACVCTFVYISILCTFESLTVCNKLTIVKQHKTNESHVYFSFVFSFFTIYLYSLNQTNSNPK